MLSSHFHMYAAMCLSVVTMLSPGALYACVRNVVLRERPSLMHMYGVNVRSLAFASSLFDDVAVFRIDNPATRLFSEYNNVRLGDVCVACGTSESTMGNVLREIMPKLEEALPSEHRAKAQSIAASFR